MKKQIIEFLNEQWQQPDTSLDSENTLVLCFGASKFFRTPSIFSQLREKYPLSKIVGCSTAGEIVNRQVSTDRLFAQVIKFEHSTVKVELAYLSSGDQSFAVGEELSEKLITPDLSAIIVLSDGLQVNGSELAKGINEKMTPRNVPVIGGLAGDGTDFGETWIVKGAQVLSGVVVGVGLYGTHLSASASTGGGWKIFGIERTITKSRGNVLYELDGRPALDIYKEYLGDKACDLPASGLFFPLYTQTDVESPRKYVRTVLGVNEQDKSIVFAGDMPEGCVAQLMAANKEKLIEGGYLAAENIVNRLKSQSEQIAENVADSLTIAVSCVGRRLVLGDRCDEEVSALKDVFGDSSQTFGFYSYGELLSKGYGVEYCNLHNQSITVLNLFEVESAKKEAA